MTEEQLAILKRMVTHARSNHWSTITLSLTTVEALIEEVERERDQ